MTSIDLDVDDGNADDSQRALWLVVRMIALDVIALVAKQTTGSGPRLEAP